MEEYLGKVTIAPRVLVTIVRKTAASVPGVAKLCENVPGVRRLLGIHSAGEGVAGRVIGNSSDLVSSKLGKRCLDAPEKLQIAAQVENGVGDHRSDPEGAVLVNGYVVRTFHRQGYGSDEASHAGLADVRRPSDLSKKTCPEESDNSHRMGSNLVPLPPALLSKTTSSK